MKLLVVPPAPGGWRRAAFAVAVVLTVAGVPRRGLASDATARGQEENPAAPAQPSTPAKPAKPILGEGEVLTLDDAVQIAVRNNPAVENASLQVGIRKHELQAVKTQQLPNFGIGFLGDLRVTGPPTQTNNQFQNLPDLGGTAVFADQNRATGLMGARVLQPILGLHAIHLQIRLRQALVESAEEEVGRQEQTVAASVASTYYDLLQTQEAVAANEASIQFYTETERTVSDKVQQGTALEVDLLDVRARLATEQANGTKLRNTFATGQETLNRQLGRDPRTKFQVAPVPETPLTEMDVAALEETALANRPEVRQGELSVRQATINKRLAQAEYIPTLNVGATYFHPANNSVLADHIATIGMVVLWEPWDWGRRRENVRATALAISQASNTLDDTKAQVIIEVNTQTRNIAAAQADLRARRLAQEATRERARVTLGRYQQGLSLLSEVFQTQTASLTATAAYQQALSDYLTALADLAKAVGQEVMR
jgi:outer membrane protein TolC